MTLLVLAGDRSYWKYDLKSNIVLFSSMIIIESQPINKNVKKYQNKYIYICNFTVLKHKCTNIVYYYHLV